MIHLSQIIEQWAARGSGGTVYGGPSQGISRVIAAQGWTEIVPYAHRGAPAVVMDRGGVMLAVGRDDRGFILALEVVEC